MIDIPGCSERTNFKTNNVFNISKERDHKKLISRHFALNGNLSGETGAKKFGGNYFSIDGSHSKIAFSASELSCTHLTIV
jgi:hypothetical protein